MLPASTTDLVTRADYAPYGAVRGTDNLPTDHGWLNQVSDEASAGLVYLNARYYDPEASRFVSPDPLVKPMDPTDVGRVPVRGEQPRHLHGLHGADGGLFRRLRQR